VVALREAAGEGSMLPWTGALVAAAMLLLARRQVGWERVWYE
jgi:hypothetical protein